MSNVSLEFATKEEAIAFCEKHGWEYAVTKVIDKVPKAKSYGANFSW